MECQARDGFKFQVRKFKLSDFQSVYDIDIKSYDLVWEAERWRKHERDVLVAVVQEETGERVVAFCVADTSDGMIRVLKIATTPKYRRKQIASMLVFAMLKRHRKIKKAMAIVGESQSEAQVFLSHLHFTRKKTIDNFPTYNGVEQGYIFEGSVDAV